MSKGKNLQTIKFQQVRATQEKIKQLEGEITETNERRIQSQQMHGTMSKANRPL